jgi:hypothetical protein
VSQSEYADKVTRFYTRLKQSGDILRLAAGENARIVITADVDEWVEIPVHRVERGLQLCTRESGECEACLDGDRPKRRFVIPIHNLTIDEPQFVVWAYYRGGPLEVLRTLFEATGQPIAGMVLDISRVGQGLGTEYPLRYVGHRPEYVRPAPPREVVMDIVRGLYVRGGKEEE